MQIRSLNSDGLQLAVEILAQLRSTELESVPTTFLNGDDYSEALALDLRPPKAADVPTRWQLGLWLYQKLDAKVSDRVLSSPGFWTWLAFALFDIICPIQGGDSQGLQ